MKVLITGVAGFIGYHIAKKLISQNVSIVGIDNLRGQIAIGGIPPEIIDIEHLNIDSEFIQQLDASGIQK